MLKSSSLLIRQIHRNLLSDVGENVCNCSFKSLSTVSKQHKLNRFAYVMLGIPGSAFSFGCWQVYQYFVKQNLVNEIEEKLKKPAVPFTPALLETGDDYEYKNVSVRGTFDHSKEMIIGPRSLLGNDKHIIPTTDSGYNVVTPFTLEDTGRTILVNRGFVPRDQATAEHRMEGQVEGVQSLTGYLRYNETAPPQMHGSRKNKNNFFPNRDIKSMADRVGADYVFIDACESVPGGPIGGQTGVKIKNEHVQFTVASFIVSGITGAMWYKLFMKTQPLLRRI